MTLLSSLNIAVNGLAAQAYSISNISNNLSNASTTAFKSSTTSFEDVVSACDAESTSYSGKCGVLASTTNHNSAQGTILSSLTGTNLAISGNGYFPVETAVVTVLETPTGLDYTTTFNPGVYYTRAGDFSLNASNYLENSNGFYLMGYTVDPATSAVGTELVPIQISTTLVNATIPTTALDYSANLNASVDVGATSSSSSVAIYASDYDPTLRNTHNVSYAWEKLGVGTVPGPPSTDVSVWALTISAVGGTFGAPGGDDYSATINVAFDGEGKLYEIDDTGTGYTVNGTSISFDLGYQDADPQTISCDLSGITQFASSPSSTLASDVAHFLQNGTPEGSYSGIEINGSGDVAINYNNGISVIYYQIAMATFLNTDDLEAMSGNAYRSTNASGSATYTTAGNDGAGTIKVSALESSNVDIANEFTTMIQTQQVYSANAKVVSAVNSMMQTLIQMQSV
ncbi:MAG: flagellar hook-basal body complex protein [Bdellovibrionales bacterium]